MVAVAVAALVSSAGIAHAAAPRIVIISGKPGKWPRPLSVKALNVLQQFGVPIRLAYRRP